VLAVVVLMPVAQFVLGMLYYRMRNTLWGVFGARRSRARVAGMGLVAAMATVAVGAAFVWMSEWGMRWDVAVAYGVVGLVFAGMMVWQARVRGPVEIGDTMWASLEVGEV
jgi:hypothetical protein